MAETLTMRLVAENRKGLRGSSYLTFYVSGSRRDREVIPFPAGKFLSGNGLGNLWKKDSASKDE